MRHNFWRVLNLLNLDARLLRKTLPSNQSHQSLVLHHSCSFDFTLVVDKPANCLSQEHTQLSLPTTQKQNSRLNYKMSFQDRAQHQVSQLDKELSKYQVLNDFEKQTSVPKVYAVLGLAGLYFFLVFFNIGGEFLVNFAGFIIPGYYSLGALFSASKVDDSQVCAWEPGRIFILTAIVVDSKTIPRTNPSLRRDKRLELTHW